MAVKTPPKQKAAYDNYIKELGSELLNIVQEQEELANEQSGYAQLALHADIALNRANYYLKMYELGIEHLHAYKDEYLSKARQNYSSMLELLEKQYHNTVNTTFSEIMEELKTMPVTFPELSKLHKKLAITLTRLKNYLYTASKYKYTYIELEGRTAVVLKNMFNFKKYQEENDPRVEGYAERNDLLNAVIQLLDTGAKGFREKFEMQGNDTANMKKAIDYLHMQQKIYSVMGRATDADTVKKTAHAWEQRLLSYQKKMDEINKRR